MLILVPALLGLKGNLEMTSASALSTQVNSGMLHSRKLTIKAILGHTLLVQAQSIVLGLLASFVATVVDVILAHTFDYNHLLTLVATSITTASCASILLGSVMKIIILLSKKFHINPDNVATPIAASLGDLITLVILSYVGNLYYNLSKQPIQSI